MIYSLSYKIINRKGGEYINEFQNGNKSKLPAYIDIYLYMYTIKCQQVSEIKKVICYIL